MTTELIELLIRVLDKKLLPTGSSFLSGRLGILVQDLGPTGSYIVTIIGNENLHLTVERLQDLKNQLEKDPFTDMKVKLYLNEMRKFGNRHLRITEFQIFVGKREE